MQSGRGGGFLYLDWIDRAVPLDDQADLQSVWKERSSKIAIRPANEPAVSRIMVKCRAPVISQAQERLRSRSMRIFRKEGRRILDFIWDDRPASELIEKSHRIFRCQLTDGRVVKRYLRCFRELVQKEGGFSGLARPATNTAGNSRTACFAVPASHRKIYTEPHSHQCIDICNRRYPKCQ